MEHLEARQMLAGHVTTLVDVVDAGDGVTSFREALASGGLVTFNPSLAGGTISLASQLVISSSTMIDGPGAQNLTVDAKGLGRSFFVTSSAGAVLIEGLTITGGANVDAGGGIYNQGDLTLNAVAIKGNHTILNGAGSNTGGGVFVQGGGSLHLLNSTIDGNQARWGGGLYVNLTGGSVLEIIGSTVSNNIGLNQTAPGVQSDGIGGGLFLESTSSHTQTASIVNSTFSGNRSWVGAGVSIRQSGAKALLVNVTVHDNRTTDPRQHEAPIPGGQGGGVHAWAATGAPGVTMHNSIVAGNVATESATRDAWGNLNGNGIAGAESRHNLIGLGYANVGIAHNPTTVGNYVGTSAPIDARLAPLANSGGATQTHAPLSGSLAIDHGYSPAVAPWSYDQRGFDRFVDDPATPPGIGGLVDMGAVEIGARILVSGDFNGDRRADALYYSADDRAFTLLAGASNSAGHVAEAWGVIAGPLASGNWVEFIAGDFNGDGRDDVLMRNGNGNAWALAVSDGTEFHVRELPGIVGAWPERFVGDFDGDEADELLVREDSNDNWSVLRFSDNAGARLIHTGNGSMRVTVGQPLPTLYVGDANRDDRDDLIRRNSDGTWTVSLSGLNPDGTGILQVYTAGLSDWGDWFDVGFENGKLDVDKPYDLMLEAFSWVYNNVELELYPGLMKGPTATEQTKAGNDWDQAALLESKLDELGIAAQIAAGTVEATATQVQNWLGVTTTSAALKIVQDAIDGNAQSLPESGVLPERIRFRHAWVQAAVPTTTGMSTVALDPSWKFQDRQQGLSVGIPFDEWGYLALDASQDRRLPLEYYEDQVMEYLVHPIDASHPQNTQGSALADVPNDGPILTKLFTTLPIGVIAGTAVGAVTDHVVNDYSTIVGTPSLAALYTHGLTMAVERLAGPVPGGWSYQATEDLSNDSSPNVYSATEQGTTFVINGVQHTLTEHHRYLDLASSFHVAASGTLLEFDAKFSTTDHNTRSLQLRHGEGGPIWGLDQNFINSYAVKNTQGAPAYSADGFLHFKIPVAVSSQIDLIRFTQTWTTNPNSPFGPPDDFYKHYSAGQTIVRNVSIAPHATSLTPVDVGETARLATSEVGLSDITLTFVNTPSQIYRQSVLAIDGSQILASSSSDPAQRFFANDRIRLTLKHFVPTALFKSADLVGFPKEIAFIRDSGSVISVSLDANQHSRDSLVQKQQDLLAAIADGVSAADIDELGNYTGAKYWADFNRDAIKIAGLTNTIPIQNSVGSGIVSADPTLLTVNGSTTIDYLPYRFAPQNFGVDLPNAVQGMRTRSGGTSNTESFQLVSYHGSALEHDVVEGVISAESISTMKGLQRAFHQTLGVHSDGTSASGDRIHVFESDANHLVDGNERKVVWRGDHAASVTSSAALDNLSQPATRAYFDADILTSVDGIDDGSAPDTPLSAFSQAFIDSIISVLKDNSRAGITRVLVPEAKTKVNNWIGTVYVAEFPGQSTKLAIVPDGGEPANGGFSGDLTSSWAATLQSGSFPNFAFAGDPVNVANGNMFRDETDFVFPNLGVPLTFSRHYDAQSKDDILLGAGWTFTFGDVIYSEGDDRVWLDSKGVRHTFKAIKSGGVVVDFEAPAELQGVLTFTGASAALGSVDFIFKSSSGLEHHFRKVNYTPEYEGSPTAPAPRTWVGRLAKVVDRNGDGVQISFLGDDTPATNDNFPYPKRIVDIHDANRYIEIGSPPIWQPPYYHDISVHAPGNPVTTWRYEMTKLSPTHSNGFNEFRLTRVTGNFGSGIPLENQRITQYEHYQNSGPSAGLIKRITEADGAWHEYEYYANGRTFRVKQGDPGEAANAAGGDVQTFNYNLISNRTEFTDERGNVETYIHQDNGLLLKQIHADGTQQKFSWGAVDTPAEFLMTSTTDERGAVEKFEYYLSPSDPGFQQLKEAWAKHYVGANGTPLDAASVLKTRYNYLRDYARPHVILPNSIVVDINGENRTTAFGYFDSGESLGKLKSTTDPEGYITEVAYYSAGESTGSLAYRQGLLKSKKQPAIANAAGVLVAHETLFNYDAAGNVVTAITDGLPTTTLNYDSWGNATRSVDATGVVVDSVYDALGRLIETGFGVGGGPINPIDALTTKYKYDAMGRVRESIDPLGRVTQFMYDGRGRLIKQINADESEFTHEYDALGNCVAKTDELGRTTQFVYDARNRLIQTIHADGSIERLRYDGTGNVVSSADALGAVTQFKYDAVGRLTEAKLPDPDGPLSSLAEPTATNKYNKFGELIETIDPNFNVTQFKYDRLGQVTRSRTLAAAEFAAWNAATRTNHRNSVSAHTPSGAHKPAALATTAYDAVGNVSQVVVFDVASSSLTASALLNDPASLVTAANQSANLVQVVVTRFDAFGRPIKVLNADHTASTPSFTAVEYDATGRVLREFDELGRVTERHYDSLGRLEWIKLADPDGSVTAYTSPQTFFEYDAAGNQIAATDPRGFTTRLEYNVRNQLVATTDALGGRSRNLYDAAGQLVAAVDALGRAAYTLYDDRGRAVLERQADPDGAGKYVAPTTRYKYDDAGRIIEKVDPLGYPTKYAYDALGRLKSESYIASQVADDGDLGFLPYNGDTFQAETGATGLAGFGGDATRVYRATTTGGDYPDAFWTFDNVPAGVYRLSATWTPNAAVGQWMTPTMSLDGMTFLTTPDAFKTATYTPSATYYYFDQQQGPNDFHRFDEGAPRSWEQVPVEVTLGPGTHTLRFGMHGDPATWAPLDAVRIERTVARQFAYDANGNRLTETDALGRVTTTQYDELDRVKIVTLPAPGTTGPESSPQTLSAPVSTTVYDGYGNVTRVIGSRGGGTNQRTTKYEYNRRNWRSKEMLDFGADGTGGVADYANQRTDFSYDLAGNLTSRDEYSESTTGGQFTLERRTLFGYDGLNRQTSSAVNFAFPFPADMHSTVTTYDAAGNVVAVQEATANDLRQLKTEFTYDALGRRTSEIASGKTGPSTTESRTTRFQYDAVGNLTATVDGVGRISQSEYDRLDRLAKSLEPVPGNGQAQVTTSYQYDPAGNLVAETKTPTETQRWFYDGRGNLVRSIDGRGDVTVRRYDAEGNLTSLVDPAKNVTRYAYDNLDRLIEETAYEGATPKPRKYVYDKDGNLALSVDRNGRAIRYQYDRLDRVAEERWFATEAAGRANSAATNVSTAYSDAIRSFYDELGRREETQHTHRTWNGNAWSTDYRLTDSYVFDKLDRATEHSNQSVQTGADDLDSLDSASVAATAVKQTYAYSYNSSYAQTDRRQFVGGVEQAQTLSLYGPFGDLRVVSDSDPTTSAGLTFGPHLAKFTYDASGLLMQTLRLSKFNLYSQESFDNHAKTTYARDAAGRLSGLTHQTTLYNDSSTPQSVVNLLHFGYLHDAAGRISLQSTGWNSLLPAFSGRPSFESPEFQSFQYDAAGQLTLVDSSLGAGASFDSTYVYNPNGNRSSSTEPVGGSDAYANGPHNRVSQDSTYSYIYDNEGNLVERTSIFDAARRTYYTWDHRNRLVHVVEMSEDHTVLDLELRYNADDDVVYRDSDAQFTDGRVIERYVVEGGQRTMTLDDANEVARRYAYGAADELLWDEAFDASGQETSLLLPLGDHQNSTRIVLHHDAGNALQPHQSIDYAQFGRVTAIRNASGALVQSGSVPDLTALDTAFTHHGSALDGKTGLQLKGARWYSPDLGRFVSEDPIQDGENWYAFAGNDPVNFADPTGFYQAGHPLAGGFSGGRLAASKVPLGGLLAGGPGTSVSIANSGVLGGNDGILQRVGNSNTFLGPVRSTPSAGVLSQLQPIVTANQAGALDRQFAQATPYLRDRLPAAAPRQYSASPTGQFALGLGDSAVEGVQGLYQTARHPIDTVTNVGRALYQFDQTLQAIASDYYQKSQTARGQGQIVGDVLQTFLTGGALKAAKEAGTVGNVTAKLQDVGGDLGRLRVTVDAGTFSSGPLPLGGVKVSLAPKTFSSFGALKRELGPAGEGKVYHHIVEQRATNVDRFGAIAIHNTDNVVTVPREVNQQVANYYSTKRTQFTGNQTVREWLNTKSYAQQREFGADILKRVQAGKPLP